MFSLINKNGCKKICWLNILKKQRNSTKKAREKHQNLSEEEKETKQLYGLYRYKNLAGNEKQRLDE